MVYDKYAVDDAKIQLKTPKVENITVSLKQEIDRYCNKMKVHLSMVKSKSLTKHTCLPQVPRALVTAPYKHLA